MKTTTNKTVKKENTKVIKKGFSPAEIFAQFQAKQSEIQAEINEIKAIKKAAKRVKSEHISLINNVLLLIYNAGEIGITVSEIMEAQPLKNKKEAFNIHTINRDWNVNSAVQVGQTNLNEKGVQVVFMVDVNEPSAENLKGKQNNRIVLPEPFRPILKEYLLSKNVTEEMFTV